MKIINGRLVDYNYFEIKEIVQEAMTYWKSRKLLLVVKEFKEFVNKL